MIPPPKQTKTAASGAVHPHKLIKNQLANAPPPEKRRIPVRQAMLNSAARNLADSANPPGDTIARKDPPEKIVHNPAMAVMAPDDQSKECAAVSDGTVAAAPNTAMYRAKYGSAHYRPGDNEDEESSEEYHTGDIESLEGLGSMHPWNNEPEDEGGDERHDPEGEGGDESQHEPEGEGDESPSLGFLSSHEDIDDDDYVDIDDDAEDEMRSSFPKNSNRSGNDCP